MTYRDKQVIVLGAGRSGVASAEFLRRRGATVRMYDDRLLADQGEELFCHTYDFAVISPGIPPSIHAVTRLKECGVPILSELDLAYINSPSRHIVAISGTNGKTTTCRILFEMLSDKYPTHLVGNIGVPFIGEVESIDKKDVIVAEVSSFQIEQSSCFRPEIAALTNLGEDHLDRHKSAERYREIKKSLLLKAKKRVINADDPHQSAMNGVRYSARDRGADFAFINRKIIFEEKEYPLPEHSRGAGFDLDFLCAFAVASSFCGAKKSFCDVYDRVKIPSYRYEYIGELEGAKVYNDSKATNIDATLFAASLLNGSAAIILGGSDKGEDYARLMKGLENRADRFYLVGANAGDMYLAAREGMREKCRLMSDLDSCVRDFAQDPLEILLLSPASASFDCYRNYEERGKCFDEIVRKYRAAD